MTVAFPLKANWQRNRLWFSSTNCYCTGLSSLNICTSLHPQPCKTHTVNKRNNTHLKYICRIHVCFLLIYHTFVEAISPHKLFFKLHLVNLVGIFCKEKSVVDINNILRMALIVFALTAAFECWGSRLNWEQVSGLTIASPQGESDNDASLPYKFSEAVSVSKALLQ